MFILEVRLQNRGDIRNNTKRANALPGIIRCPLWNWYRSSESELITSCEECWPLRLADEPRFNATHLHREEEWMLMALSRIYICYKRIFLLLHLSRKFSKSENKLHISVICIYIYILRRYMKVQRKYKMQIICEIFKAQCFLWRLICKVIFRPAATFLITFSDNINLHKNPRSSDNSQ